MEILSQDKALHFVVGFNLGVLTLSLSDSLLLGAVVPAVVGAAKELVWDAAARLGTPDLADALWTVLGGLAGSAITWLLKRLLP
jgi:hypothetical protein